MILRNDDALRGVDDFVAEIAPARRARQRNLANTSPLFWRRFTRQPTQFDDRGHVVVDPCECLLLGDHNGGCVCEHDIERIVYRGPGRTRALRDATARVRSSKDERIAAARRAARARWGKKKT